MASDRMPNGMGGRESEMRTQITVRRGVLTVLCQGCEDATIQGLRECNRRAMGRGDNEWDGNG